LPSITETHEFVVPRSIPIIFPMFYYFLVGIERELSMSVPVVSPEHFEDNLSETKQNAG